MGRCGCGDVELCLSTNPGNTASYDLDGCLYVASVAPGFGFSNQPSMLDLTAIPQAVWTDTGMAVILPTAGTYEVTLDIAASVHTAITGSGGTASTVVSVQLWNETLSDQVPNMEGTLLTIGSSIAGRYESASGRSLHAFVTTTGPEQIRAQVEWSNVTEGTATASMINPSMIVAGGSSLNYQRIA